LPRTAPPTYDEIKATAKALGINVAEILALHRKNDPYAAGMPYRARNAEWFAVVVEKLEIPHGWHLRRIHYLLVSRPDIVPWPDGRNYENTDKDWEALCYASRDAIALGLAPSDCLIDQRNDQPFLGAFWEEYAPEVEVYEGTILYQPWHKTPQLQVRELSPGVRNVGPRVARPYVVEIWAEKTTVNDVLMPLARQYGLNVVTASGEISAIACRRAVDRAIDAARPIRILYVSDFDPAGMGMPVSMARKVEYEIDRRGADVDIQVRPIVLTHDQCIDYRLPRTPIKETEKRGAHFEKRFGEGATELDALEALHPGELRRILEREIRRYWNPNHDDQIDDAGSDFQALLREINGTVRAEFADELDALDKELQRFNKRLSKTRQKARASSLTGCNSGSRKSNRIFSRRISSLKPMRIPLRSTTAAAAISTSFGPTSGFRVRARCPMARTNDRRPRHAPWLARL
jgi:hypothetical protein